MNKTINIPTETISERVESPTENEDEKEAKKEKPSRQNRDIHVSRQNGDKSKTFLRDFCFVSQSGIRFVSILSQNMNVSVLSAWSGCGISIAMKKSKKFSCKQKIALIMLTTADFLSFCSMSIPAPFYPQEAAKKGMSESMAGFVFGFYALIIFLSSPIFGKILPKLGVKFSFIGGVLISGLCNILFGTLHNIEDYYLFTTLSFLIRGLEALGSSAYSTASYVTVINVFPDNSGAVRGILEIFVGLGLSAGPAIGGLLFDVGGFGLPFYVIGSILILIAPLNVYLLPSTNQCTVQPKSGSLTKLLKLTSILVTCSIIVVISMTWSFLDPTLEPHLRKFDLSSTNVGLIFLLLSAMYGIFGPVWGWITDKMKNFWWLMILGLFCNSVSLLFLGPSPIFPFLEDSIWLNIVALSTLGISVGMSLVPTYQAIVDNALQGGLDDDLGTHGVVAGVWSSMYSLGEVLGPIIGGVLLEDVGFPLTATVFSILNFVVASVGTLYFFSKKKSKKDSLIANQIVYESYKQKNAEI